jgi:hypothetical protein
LARLFNRKGRKEENRKERKEENRKGLKEENRKGCKVENRKGRKEKNRKGHKGGNTNRQTVKLLFVFFAKPLCPLRLTLKNFISTVLCAGVPNRASQK